MVKDTVNVLMCEQGAVVDGIYTRGAALSGKSCQSHSPSAAAAVSCSSPGAGSNVAAVSSAGPQLSATSPCSKPTVPSPLRVCSVSSVPVKTGIVPPSSQVGLHSPSSSSSQTDRGWREFEEALSDEFVSFASPTAAASSPHQSRAAVSSSSLIRQPLRAPSTMMPSTSSLLLF